MTTVEFENLLEFLKKNKALMQKNDIDTLYDAAFHDELVSGIYLLTDFLINTCKIPVLKYMTKIPAFMFTGLSIKSLTIPDNIKQIDEDAFRRLFFRHNTSIDEVIIYAQTKQVCNAIAEFDKIVVKEPIKQFNPPTCDVITSITLPKSCTRLSDGFAGNEFTIETPYRENQNEKLRISERDLGWAKAHIKFIHDDTETGENN